ncbi:PAS domain S-box protein [Anatilimnocola floriformis]|uniref:PAS domain S-box protein n=1 Tax=Anatilimnocola floriformis TaxID=2948575 RepID=UPI0020C3F116|nr:PAS domain S-box protein [Anatilimnocola floriformis]
MSLAATALAGTAIDTHEALRVSEARFQALFDQAAVGMVEFDSSGKISRTNESYCRIVGRTMEEVVGRTSDHYTHPADLGLAREYIGRIEAKTSLRAVFEKRYLRPDGAAVWARATLSPLFDESGKFTRLLGIVEDISEQKSAEDRIRFLMSVSDTVRPLSDPEEIVAVSARLLGEFVEADRCAYAEVAADQNTMNLTGNYTRGVKSIVGVMKFSDFGDEVHQLMLQNKPYVVYDIDSHQPAVDVAKYRETQIQAVICVPLHKQGRFVGSFAVHQARPRIWTSDEIQMVQAVATRCWESIERARIARQLRDREQRYRTFVDTVSSVVWLTSASGAMDADNPSWGGYTGQTFEEYRDFGWLNAIHPDDRANTFRAWSEAVATVKMYEVEYRVRRHDGEYRHVIARGAPVMQDDGSVKEWVGNCSDNQAERQLLEQNIKLLASERAARAEAERNSRLKDEFLATLSHELRTPLSAILGWSQLLQRTNMSSEEAREGLATIERNARAQAQLIEDLLDMSRIISGKIRLDVQTVDLPAVIKAAVGTVKHSAATKQIEVRCTLDAKVTNILGDPNRIQQVVWNLLSNSIKFTPPHGNVEVALQRTGSHIEISVSDSGAGIAPEFLPHVFERFRQADATTTRRHGGLGLGLAIVKNLVELHGGSVSVWSAGENQGSTFKIQLPVSVRMPGEPPTAHDAEQTPAGVRSPLATAWVPPNLAGVRVMVVDDEPDARDLARRILKECQAEVTVAKNGREALHMLRISPPDVLVSDIGMPELDGYELLRRARAAGCQTPAAALTAFARAEDRAQALEAGFQTHLTKPIEARDLVTAVAQLVGRA